MHFKLLLIPVFVLTLAASAFSQQGDWRLNASTQATIWDDRYRLGVGGELGVLHGLTEVFDVALNAHYHFYGARTAIDGISERGIRAVVFMNLVPGDVNIKGGLHAGLSLFDDEANLDLGADFQAVFRATPQMDIYATFIPGVLIGSDSQMLVRIGIGAYYHLGQ